MATKREKLFSEFPPVSKEEWVEKVTADLKGAPFDKKMIWRTSEGFSVQPMYFRGDIENFASVHNLPNEYPYVRSTKLNNEWFVRQNITVEEVSKANEKALDLLGKGITSLGFKIRKEDVSENTIALLLRGIDLTAIEINFVTCVSKVAELIEVFSAYIVHNGIDAQKIIGSFEYNPFKPELVKGIVVSKEHKRGNIEKVWEVGKQLPGMRLFSVDALLLNNAGAYITQELGYALSWGAELLDILISLGHDVSEVTRRIKFNFGISANYFMEIAKFRAARWLWAEIVGAYGDQYKNEAAKIYQNATTSEWNMTTYDAYVNLLRTQTETMSAAIAGVDSITVLPFNTPYENPTDFSERLARNQQLLLSEESHFDKVIDPAGGSYYIETLTYLIAQESWKLFLAVEQEGGFGTLVENGEVQKAVNDSNKKRHEDVAKRKETLLGTNEFPNFNEAVKDNIAKEVGGHSCGCHGEKTQSIEKLNFDRAASEFEALRLATEQSRQPIVFMLTIGNLAMRLARSQFAGNFFGCAGYKLIDNLGFDSVQEGIDAAINAKADIVVLCSSDDEYEVFAPEAFKILNNRAVFVVAGNPACTEQLREIGIEHFIHVKSNVLETLRQFNHQFELGEQ
ncbi:MAG: methylmalonyl-CoA mutase small subunit [Porphyromonas sp.]|nr:methylmalonyl-CoA mutase small subunit [Porphyromonas sp.]